MTKTLGEKFWPKVDKSAGPDGCWLWTGAKFGNGYGHMIHVGANILAHRASWEIHHGPIPKGKVVCHRCDNRACVNPRHLFTDTQQENILDAVRKGRWRPGRLRGLSNGSAKLTAEQVLKIRALARQGIPRRELVLRYGVSESQIHRIVRCEKWQHI